MILTDEQDAAVAAFLGGAELAIEAGAGTGKTSTLVYMAELANGRKGQYVAFNKAIVEEAALKMPRHVRCNTASSLAFGAVGRQFRHRLSSTRMRSWDIARRLGIEALELEGRRLSAGFLASAAMRAVRVFEFSDDFAPSAKHIAMPQGLDVVESGDHSREGGGARDSQPASAGPVSPESPLSLETEAGATVPPEPLPRYRAMCEYLEPFLAKVWDDLRSPTGTLPYSHDAYLKLFEESGAYVSADFLLVDEAQDLSPVLISIIRQQEHAQVVLVGDTQQTLYEWRGCRNALAEFAEKDRLFLTHSFRFGPEIAEQANVVLASLDTPLRLVGRGGPSRVGPCSSPDAILTRSNGGAVRVLMAALDDRRSPVLLGGGGDIIAFCRAAEMLGQGRAVDHPDLGCFASWHDVQQYVVEDPQGDELALLVSLVDRFGAATIINALEQANKASHHDLVISTCHKAKGKEWDTVRLHDDFTRAIMGAEEYRVLYVGVTRAKSVLDMGGNAE